MKPTSKKSSKSKLKDEGYMQDAQGRLIPLSKIKPMDLERDKLVKQIAADAKIESDILFNFKKKTMKAINSFSDKSAKEYKVGLGGEKGNITLLSYDGKLKIVRSVSEYIVFNERLQVAKALINECIQEWSDGSRDEIKVLINDAFSVNKQGKIDKNRILGLRRVQIKHPKWKKAMDAITESIQVANSKEYIRVYEQTEDGRYLPINLDIAAIEI